MTVGIIGSGTMGSGIAQVAATAGCTVKVYDTNQEALTKSEAKLQPSGPLSDCDSITYLPFVVFGKRPMPPPKGRHESFDHLVLKA